MSEKQTCETCRWWDRTSPFLSVSTITQARIEQGFHTELGHYCKRFPAPVAKSPADFCGEHAPLPQQGGKDAE